MVLSDDTRECYADFCYSRKFVGDEVCPMWGMECVALSMNDVMHILNGGYMYASDGEYATLIALRMDDLETGEKVTKQLKAILEN